MNGIRCKQQEKVSVNYFFLCLFALALFLRLCVEIFALFLFLPLGITFLFYKSDYFTDLINNLLSKLFY